MCSLPGKGLCPESQECLQLHLKTSLLPDRRMGKRLESAPPQIGEPNSKRRCSNSLSLGKWKFKPRDTTTDPWKRLKWKTDNTKRWWGCGATGTPIHRWWGCQLTDIWENYLAVSTKAKHILPYDPSNSTPRYTFQRNIFTKMEPRYSKVWSRASSISFTWELVRPARTPDPSQTYSSITRSPGDSWVH